MTEPSESSYVAVKRVDTTGRIDGLTHHAGKEVLLIRLPYLEKDRMDAWVRDMEEEAAQLAKRLDLDPERARSFVRDVAHGAGEAGKATMQAVNRLTTHAVVAKESAEEQKAVQDVADAARKGGADWEPNPADKADYDAQQRHGGGSASGSSGTGTRGGAGGAGGP